MIGDAYRRELLDHVSGEGNPSLIFEESDWEEEMRQFPQEWRDMLVSGKGYLSNFRSLWNPLIPLLPKTTAMVENKLQGLAVLLTDRAPPSLVYFFLKDGELYAHRGYAPSMTLPEVSGRLAVSLEPFYSVHDGWVDLFTEDAGLAPSSRWEIIGLEKGVCNGLLVVFEVGGSSLGFDLDDSPAQPHILWADGGVEWVEDFWSSLDDWMYRQFSARDDNVV